MGNVIYMESPPAAACDEGGISIPATSLIPGQRIIDKELILDRAALEAGRIIHFCRTNAGLTQGKLAVITGMDQSAIAKLENGKSRRGPTLATLLTVAAACNVTLKISCEPANVSNSSDVKGDASVGKTLYPKKVS